MKRILVLIAFFSFYNLYGQSFQSREEMIANLKSPKDIKVSELGNDIIKVDYPQNKTKYFNTNNYENTKTNSLKSASYDSTVIDIWSIDTTLYYQKYTLWTEVPLSTGMSTIPFAADLNNNGLAELYGYEKQFNSTWDTIPLKVFELSASDSNFKEIYRYPDTMVVPLNAFDINLDGNHLR